jgi:hypothetical protein
MYTQTLCKSRFKTKRLKLDASIKIVETVARFLSSFLCINLFDLICFNFVLSNLIYLDIYVFFFNFV